MTDTTERPLVTFAVIAYNQERFIREAIEGAFAQTYEPLEIILSDDCSPDRTYQIMQDMAAAYEGPHKVVLNRNEPNLGIVPHVDRVMELVQGEFIIVNAGDDVSLPERTAKMAEAWHSSNGRVSLVHTCAEKIGLTGDFVGYRRPLETMQRNPEPKEIIEHALYVIGATAGWDRRVFDTFGPLAPGLEIEDHIIPFRARLIGQLIYIDDPLIKNRVGGISKRDEASRSYDYLYGSYNKARRWIAETDDYFLERLGDLALDGKADLEEKCRYRSAILGFSVRLAQSSRAKRLLSLPHGIKLAFRFRSLNPIKDYLRYNLDHIYMIYAERVNFSSQKQNPRSTKHPEVK